MPLKSAVPLFQRSVPPLACLAILLSCSACSESQRLAQEAGAVAEATSTLEASTEALENDFNAAFRTRDDLRNEAARTNPDSDIATEIKGLEERKQALEGEIAAITSDFDRYRKSDGK